MCISDCSSYMCSSDLRAIRTLIAAALAQLEVETGTAIAASVDPATLDRWRASVSELRPDGQTQQSWLWAAPAKHSTRQISEVLERIDLLYTLDVHKPLATIPDQNGKAACRERE